MYDSYAIISIMRGKGKALKGINQICSVCGKSFYVYPSAIGKYATCSTKCKAIRYKGRLLPHSVKWGRHISKAKIGKPVLKLRKPLIINICEFCGEEFEVSRHAYSRKRIARFCSLNCWYKFIRMKPENHPGYKGGYEPYYGPTWPSHRKLALKRDDYHCQHCHKKTRQVRLDVHHIIPFREFNGDWEQANKLHNLITLCCVCHTSHNSKTFPLPLL